MNDNKTLLYIAGVFDAKRTKRGGHRYYTRVHGPIIVKRDELKRDYNGEYWTIHHMINGLVKYHKPLYY